MVPIYLPVFGGYQYEYWSVQMKTVLKATDLWDVVESGIEQEPPQETHESEWDLVESGIEQEPRQETNESEGGSYAAYWKKCMEMKDATALQLIQNAVSFDIFPWIASATSAKEAWELLMVRSVGGPMFQSRKLVDLKKEYEGMKMRDSETIHEFTGKLMDLVFRMKSCGWKVEDKDIVKKILSSLPPRFKNVLVKVAETLPITALIDCLLGHEYNMMRPVQVSLDESVVNQSVNVEESRQEEAEILYTQSQVALTEKQMEMFSLVQMQNQEQQLIREVQHMKHLFD